MGGQHQRRLQSVGDHFRGAGLLQTLQGGVVGRAHQHRQIRPDGSGVGENFFRRVVVAVADDDGPGPLQSGRHQHFSVGGIAVADPLPRRSGFADDDGVHIQRNVLEPLHIENAGDVLSRSTVTANNDVVMQTAGA